MKRILFIALAMFVSGAYAQQTQTTVTSSSPPTVSTKTVDASKSSKVGKDYAAAVAKANAEYKKAVADAKATRDKAIADARAARDKANN